MATVILQLNELTGKMSVKPGDMIGNKRVQRIRVSSEDLAVLVFDDDTESEPLVVLKVLY
jgi:hypothetical protein